MRRGEAQDLYPRSGFVNGFQFQGCTRLAVSSLPRRRGRQALRVTGADGIPRQPGDARRDHRVAQLFWAMSTRWR